MIQMILAVASTFAVFFSLSWLGAELNARRGELVAKRRQLVMGYAEQLRRRRPFGFVRPRARVD